MATVVDISGNSPSNGAEVSKPTPATVADDARYVNTVGDTMSGDLVVSKANAGFIADKLGTPQDADIKFKTNGLTRWGITSNAIAETGSNVGSDLGINRYGDNGAFLGTVIYTRRNTGQVAIANGPWCWYGTAIPAGGTLGTGITVSSVTNFGIFFGSGVPTLSAAKGSIYLRSDGSGIADRMYVNTNGTTGWTNFATAA